METHLSSLILSALCVPFLASAATVDDPPDRDHYPGSVLFGGWPAQATGSVEQLEALRFSSELELDAVARIGDELFLVHHPARFEAYYSMGTGVRAMGVLPTPSGLDHVLSIDSRGLVVTSRVHDGPVFYSTYVVPNTSSWDQVEALWVVASTDDQYDVYASDSSALQLRSITVDAALDPTTAAAWSTPTSLGEVSGILDLFPCEYDPTHEGKELVISWEGFFLVVSRDLQSHIVSGPIGSINELGATTGSGPDDLLVWASEVIPTTMLVAANLGAAQGPPLYSLENRDFNRIQSFNAESQTAWDELLLLEADLGLATVLARDASSGFQAPFTPLSGRDTIDTLEMGAGSRPPIRCAAPGDYDNDGDVDLLVAHQEESQLRFWLNHDIPDERYRLFLDEPGFDVEGEFGPVTLSMEMKRNSGLGDHEHFEVEVWIDPSFSSTDGSYARMPTEQIQAQGPTVPYSVGFDPSLLAPDYVCWIAFTAVDLDGGAVKRRFPTRLIYWSPDTTVMNQLENAHYPVLNFGPNHAGDVIGDTTGIRNGTRRCPGGGNGPPP